MQKQMFRSDEKLGSLGPVEAWFGESFGRLDPLLQSLHRRGGVLSGQVEVTFGAGVAAWVGRRLARKLGVPDQAGLHDFRVKISHLDGALHWARTFGGGHDVVSVFVPHGVFPTGYWSEATGDVVLELGVEIDRGAWVWVQRGVRVHGIRLPLGLLPKTHAGKRIVDHGYEFSVELSLPFLGKLLSYRGVLVMEV